MNQFNPIIEETTSVWDSVGIPPRGNELYAALNKGLSFDVFRQISELTQLDKKEIANVIHLAPATLARRAKAGHFNREESDKFYRFTEVVNAAVELFEGDLAAANQWLKRPVKGLGGKKPIEMLGTSAESEAVLDLIGRLEHGVFA
ncbi:antitoxin Xre/MbcA/ParS toxin-binding domain-containing protein [Catenovulum agarivorans]|uniref:type II RES/Xre toxin-antitoxin system antitoxin n=1 Tax=Catenovulum agarivorans TaxID=1172192 RepID=UPI000313D911|nr:antitoxin Xre/MbcA/ParS toxin-binding domain-containing protein [Catenovulum agarivorans]